MMAYIMTVVMNYDVHNIFDIGFCYYIANVVSVTSLALCPGLLASTFITGTTLSTQDNVPTTKYASYNFVTQITIAKTHKQPNSLGKMLHSCFISSMSTVALPQSCRKAYTPKNLPVTHTNSYYLQCTIKYMV